MDAVELISLYNTLFYVFLGIAALGLALAVFFFFYFDIPMVFSMMTGRSKEKTIQRMQEKNAKTGNMRYQYPNHTGDVKTGRTGRTGQSKRLEKPERRVKTEELSGLEEAAAKAQVAHILAQAEEPETALLQPEATETVVLNAASETVVLNVAAPQYSNDDDLGQTEMLQPKVAPNFRFDITQAVMLIHTEERI